MKQQKQKRYIHIPVWYAIFFFIILIIFIFASCKTKYVTVPTYHNVYKEKIKTDTFKTHDSIYFRDSFYITKKNDTVYITKTKWRERFKNIYSYKIDTVRHTDTIRLPYPIIKEKIITKDKPQTKWQKFKTKVGGWTIAVAAAAILFFIFKLIKRFKKFF